ncbi:Methyltransferase domain-containing protein [Paenibacillus algorifonticola]|uniref:Methyltransferase domain-containing protein n=1 Tax=Paenibacillus algorifonticola TaxID=684063 RepID=A0A1I1YQ49_9BACL|nr:class I SAM-dependent methyltransferase [Paenibacillus algorifonticola]SFE21579.1 Methyltransferase domain-containing protein [Paenibacillus algorifonticola]
MESYGEFAAVYDELMSDMPYEDWLWFTEQCWERYGKPGVIADLGCGTGSIAIPLALTGMQVYGIDLSEDMLTVARSKWDEALSAAHGVRTGSAIWLQQDMRELELGAPVDAVISFCDCVNYLTEEADVIAAFEAVYAALRPGGVFLFDVHPKAQLIRYAEEQPFVLDEDKAAYIWTCELDEERCEIEHHLTIFAHESGERFHRFEEMHVQRAYEADWMAEQLQAAGFSKVERFADFKLEPQNESSERLFFAAVKS